MAFPNKVRGMQDILPEAHLYHTFLKKVFRHELRKNGFKRLTTPVLEQKELFTGALGTGTDIIDKEMYNLVDRKGRELVLKPESTAPIMRAYLENDMQSEPQPVFLYYVEPHFRYDRPQKGRYRQHFQIGAEIIGESDPILDAQLIYIGYKALNLIGLAGDFKIKINSIGTIKDRQKYIEELTSFYENKKHLLSEDALRKLETNPLRLLDTKIEDEIILANEAPKITKFLKKDSLDHYKKVKEYLQLLGVPYEEDHCLVRGLDYYTHTVWEFVGNSASNQSSFGGGGRYDMLSKKLGHDEEIPAVGFGMGMERLAEALMEKGIKIKDKDKIDLYFIQLGEEAKRIILPLSLEAREKGINVMVSLGTPSLKAQMKKANRLNARYVVMVGIMEASSGIYQVRDMFEGTQEEVKKENLIDYIIGKVGKQGLDFYCPAKDFILKDD
ncbi:MAG: histidine--tRNA ligase [Candidatus Gracilibacteria bacterium]|nr:histidine--tRNA ligase [Candidatus Gracilibacteria bacterium]